MSTQRTPPEKSDLLIPLEFLLERVLAVLAAIVMFAMMAVTFIDVIGRYFFNAPFPGGFEVTELMLASLIFLGLPLVTAENGHVTVDLFDPMMPNWIKPYQRMVVTCISAVAFGIMFWKLWQFAIRTYDYADITAVLEISYAPLVFLMAIMSTLSAVTLVAMVLLNASWPLLKNPEFTMTDD